MLNKLQVVCFYWIGDRWNNDGMGPEYINKLYRGVKRNLCSPFDFVCFTNETLTGLDDGVNVRPFKAPSLKGVLPRLYMFSEQAGLFGSQVLSLDLDIVITGSLDDIAAYDGDFCTRSKFAPGHEHKLDGDIISFKANKLNEKRLWEPWSNHPKKVIKLTGGRERYWFRHVFSKSETPPDRWENVAPGQVRSYKRHVMKKKKLPRDARIVSCHGNPRPHKIRLACIKDNWI